MKKTMIIGISVAVISAGIAMSVRVGRKMMVVKEATDEE